MGLLDGVAVALVVGAAVAGARWLADLVERTALVATGPVAGEPTIARAAAAALPLGAERPGRQRLTPAARSGALRPVAGPVAVGAAAAALGGSVAWATGAAPELPALVFLAGLGFVLAPVDVRAHRLPDALVLPAYPVLLVLLCLGAPAAEGGPASLVRAAEGGAVAFGVLYLLALAVPAGFGYGDVKLTGLLGAGLGWYGWSAVLDGLVHGFVYGGLCAAALLLTRRLTRTDRLAFGPFLLAGALTSLWAAR